MCGLWEHQNIETNRQSDDKPSSECWTKPAIKRVIIIVIDALRYTTFWTNPLT